MIKAVTKDTVGFATMLFEFQRLELS